MCFKEKRKTLGIRITATDFDLSEATMIADVISRIMQTARPARPIPGHVTEEINRYLQLPVRYPSGCEVIVWSATCFRKDATA